MAYAQPQVIEVVEYIDDDDWDGEGDDDYEEVVEILEQVVMVPKQNFSAVAAYEVGIGAPPPLFLTPKERAKLAAQQLEQSSVALSGPGAAAINSTTVTTRNPIQSKPSKFSLKASRPSKRISTRKRLSIVNQALQLPEEHGLSDYEEEEISDVEEIIEEEYYDEVIEDEEVVEEEYYEVDANDDEYIIEEVIEESEAEVKARQQLEAEIAFIEQQIEEAKRAKEKQLAEGREETSKEKAQRMANNSRLQACKQMKVESDFKRKAAARAKALAEKEKDWVKGGGKKKQKDLAEIIASKAKKQQKLLTRQKSRDGTKTPIKPPQQQQEVPKPAEETAPAQEKKQLSMLEMLAQKAEKGINGSNFGKAKASQVVKSAAADDFGDDDLRAEDFLPSDDEEEQEKEPELTPEEQYKKRLEWQKPTWTQAKLKTTTKGNKIKAGKTLSAPITFIPKKINEGLDEDEADNTPSAGALMKGAMKMVALPKVKKSHAALKFTGNGARMRDGRQLEKHINPKIPDKEEVKIWGASPEELKLTPRGLTARKGKGLSDDNITQATQLKKYQFEKPDWAKTKKDYLLRQTETGEHLKEGEDIAPKITAATVEKKYEFEKPSWTKAKLKHTAEGELVKQGASLSAPIVDLSKKTMNVNTEANPAFLRMTDQGEKLMEDGNLAMPITAAPEIAKQKRYGQ